MVWYISTKHPKKEIHSVTSYKLCDVMKRVFSYSFIHSPFMLTIKRYGKMLTEKQKGE